MTQTLLTTPFTGTPIRPSRPSLPTQSAAPLPRVKSTEILRGQKAVDIIHNGSTYKLQATRLGKLILTK